LATETHPIDARVSARCPVCPFDGLKQTDLRCPSCGTDLAVLRRVQELPLALLDDAYRLLARGDAEGALLAAGAAAAFERSRPQALLALGDARARLGDLAGAELDWRQAGALGLDDDAHSRLDYLVAMKERAQVEGLARTVACPNAKCRDRGRRGVDNIVLSRFYGRAHTPLWRCRTCGATFTGRRGSLLFRSRMPADRAYRVVAELLAGKSVKQTAADTSCSPATVRRLAARAVALGPHVVDEIALGLGRSSPALRRRWRAFVARADGL
jgi:hypothetical protein